MRNHADTGSHREDHFPIDLDQPLILIVHNVHGDVIVRAADRADVLVGQVMHGHVGDLAGGLLDIDARGNQIEIHAHPHPGAGWSGEIDLDAVVGQITKAFRWGGPWGKARMGVGGDAWCDIVIEVPRAISGRCEIHTTSGDARLEGITSDTTLQTVSGDVRVDRVRGSIALQSASGDITIDDMLGRISARTASGDLRVTASRIDEFDIQTASGDLVLDATLTGEGRCRAQTASGDIRLGLRRPTSSGQEPAATLAFHSISGDAHVSPPFRKTDRRTWQAGSGESGPHIEITTVSGDLFAGITAADDAAILPIDPVPHPGNDVPAPPGPGWERIEIGSATLAEPESSWEPARNDAARLAVLEAVERGEIDVEEALRQLDEADAAPNP